LRKHENELKNLNNFGVNSYQKSYIVQWKDVVFHGLIDKYSHKCSICGKNHSNYYCPVDNGIDPIPSPKESEKSTDKS